MAETEKKKAPVKAVKTAAKKTAVKTAATATTPASTSKAAAVKTAAPKTAAMKVAAKKAPTHAEVASLAHKFWQERGGHHGSDAQDWLRAERELKG
jgi:hypothetical protein